MRNKILYFTGLAILTAVYAAQPAAAPAAPAVITMATYGFRINSFESPTTGNIRNALVMSWPWVPSPKDKDLPADKQSGYPPSVNVMVVSSDKAMADYIDSERQSMKTNGMTIVADDIADATKPGSKQPKPNEWRFEYIALVGTTPMHWYTHAIWTKGRVYAATGGVPDEMWKAYSDKIKDCVNSLETTSPAPMSSSAPAATSH